MNILNKDFYFFGNRFLGLSIGTAILQGILFLIINVGFYLLDSFIYWFCTVSIISIIAAVFLLIYYHYKQYTLTFFAFIFLTIAGLYQLIIFYLVVEHKAFQSYYVSAAYILLGATVVYATSLIFSIAAKRLWLKRGGYFLLTFALILAATELWSALSHDLEVKIYCQKIQLWSSLITNLVPVLFILNFQSECRELTAPIDTTTLGKNISGLLLAITFAGLVITVVLAGKIADETYHLWSWIHRGPEKAIELAKPFEARIYINGKGDTLRYRLMKPLNYDPQKKYPFVLCLAAEFGRENFKQIEGSAASQLLSKVENRKKYPAFIFVPECPPGKSWGNMPGLPAEDSIVFETIGVLEQEFAIDDKKLYVTGHSFGGHGTWYFICARPNMFAAAMPMAGEGKPVLAKNIVDVAVWAFHGRKDRNVMVSGSRDMIEAMKAAGGHPRYTEFADERHNIWPKVEDTHGLLDWLFAQKRK